VHHNVILQAPSKKKVVTSAAKWSRNWKEASLIVRSHPPRALDTLSRETAKKNTKGGIEENKAERAGTSDDGPTAVMKHSSGDQGNPGRGGGELSTSLREITKGGPGGNRGNDQQQTKRSKKIGAPGWWGKKKKKKKHSQWMPKKETCFVWQDKGRLPRRSRKEKTLNFGHVWEEVGAPTGARARKKGKNGRQDEDKQSQAGALTLECGAVGQKVRCGREDRQRSKKRKGP